MNLFKKLGTAALLVAAGFTASAQTQSDPLLLGYQNNSNKKDVTRGLYMMTPSGTNSDLLWRDALAYDASGSSTNGNVMVAGWIRDGHLCGLETQWPIPSQSYYKYVEHDIESGEILKEENVDLSQDWTNCFLNATYCPDDDRIYGYGFNATRTGFAFKSAPADNPSQAVIIKEVGRSYPGSICYNHELGSFVGVLNVKNASDYYDNSLVSIDPNTGNTTKIFDIDMDLYSDYKCVGGIIWVPARQAYLWNFYTIFDGVNPCSKLVELNPVTKKANVVRTFDYTHNYTYFVAQDNAPVAAAGAPLPVTDFNAALGANNSATVSFTLPVKLENGNPITGNVAWTLYVDGSQTATGSAAAGTKQEKEITLAEGTHFIRVVPSFGGITGLADVNVLYIGDDSPCAPENCLLTETQLTWDAVTKGLRGNTISNVTYRVAVNGRVVGETETTSLDMRDIVLPQAALTAYQAEITALYNGRASKAGFSNKIVVGQPWSVPFTITPDAEQYALMLQQDVDGDNVKWSLDTESADGSLVLTSGFSNTEASDDWIFLPKFACDDTKVYSISFDSYLADADLPGARLEVWLGDSPEKAGMKTVIVPEIRILKENSSATYTGEFMADGNLAGKDLYIGFGVSSPAGTLSPLRIRNISVKEAPGVSANGPKAVSDLTAVIETENTTSTKVTFAMPSQTLDGTAIPADAQISATVKIQGGASAQTSGKPGENVTVSLSSSSNDQLVTVTPSYQGATGMSANTVASLGRGIPGKVENVSVAYDAANTAVMIKWDAPSVDEDGNSLEGDKLNYNIWTYNNETKQFEFAVNVPYPLQFATVNMSQNLTLQNMEIGITAANAAGESTDMYHVMCQIGTPLSLPIDDDFNGDEFKYNPITYYVLAPYNNASIKWGPTSSNKLNLSGAMVDATMGDVLCGIPTLAGAMTRFDLPKVSSENAESLILKLTLWTGQDAANTTIVGRYPSYEAIEQAGVTYYPETEVRVPVTATSDGYQTVNIELPAVFGEQPWISLSLESVYPTLASRMILAGYSLSDASGIDGVQSDPLLGSIFGGQGEILISGYAGKQIDLFTIDGKRIATLKADADFFRVPAPAGVCLVKAGTRTHKVLVK